MGRQSRCCRGRGGIAGLCCAYKLMKRGHEVTVLEGSGQLKDTFAPCARVGGWSVRRRWRATFHQAPTCTGAILRNSILPLCAITISTICCSGFNGRMFTEEQFRDPNILAEFGITILPPGPESSLTNGAPSHAVPHRVHEEDRPLVARQRRLPPRNRNYCVSYERRQVGDHAIHGGARVRADSGASSRTKRYRYREFQNVGVHNLLNRIHIVIKARNIIFSNHLRPGVSQLSPVITGALSFTFRYL